LNPKKVIPPVTILKEPVHEHLDFVKIHNVLMNAQDAENLPSDHLKVIKNIGAV
jgi:hypothetical protein